MAAFGPVAPSIASASSSLATSVPAAAAASGGFLSGLSGALSGLGSIAAPIAGLFGALAAPEPGNAESGTRGNMSIGGINVAPKVVGSGTATQIPPPETAAQSQLYSQIVPTAAGSVSANLVPVIGIAAAALVLLALIATPGKRKKGK